MPPGASKMPLGAFRMHTVCAQGANMGLGQVSDQCQIVLGIKKCESEILFIWTNTVEKRGPVHENTHSNIVLGTRLGSSQIHVKFCCPSPKGVLVA